MKPNIGLGLKIREHSIVILNRLLADESVLYTKTRNYHWHVVGESFMEYHKFLDEQYERLAEIADEVAEKIRALGGQSLGTMSEFIKNSQLREYPKTLPGAKTMLKNLLNDHETVILTLRQSIETTDKQNDAGTTDFLTGLLQEHETMAWMLRSYQE